MKTTMYLDLARVFDLDFVDLLLISIIYDQVEISRPKLYKALNISNKAQSVLNKIRLRLLKLIKDGYLEEVDITKEEILKDFYDWTSEGEDKGYKKVSLRLTDKFLNDYEDLLMVCEERNII